MYTYIFRGSIGVALKTQDPTIGFEFNVSFPISAPRRRPLDLSSEIPFSDDRERSKGNKEIFEHESNIEYTPRLERNREVSWISYLRTSTVYRFSTLSCSRR